MRKFQLLLAALATSATTALATNNKDITWNYYGGDIASTKFSREHHQFRQRTNLKVVWDAPSSRPPHHRKDGP